VIVLALGLIVLTVLVWVGRLQKPARKPEPMSVGEARALLGVSVNATAEEVRDAYARLMRKNHPDQGGTDGLAAKLNAARDKLLN